MLKPKSLNLKLLRPAAKIMSLTSCHFTNLDSNDNNAGKNGTVANYWTDRIRNNCDFNGVGEDEVLTATTAITMNKTMMMTAASSITTTMMMAATIALPITMSEA